ncbi:putative disease resistance protein RGA1 [Pyrus communis]|uniref:putative disease resistance protein RGA1 n=1 Tax=Pyrus communis TaxID=23211 RepID=UPI0035C137D0
MLDMDAAASIVLSPALQVLFDRLASPLLQKASDLLGYNDNFQSLQHALVRAQATLEVAEEQQFTNRAARLWLLDLKNAVCDTQDILDFFTARENWNHIFRLSISDDGIIKPEKLRVMLQGLERTVTEGFRMFNIREPTQLLPGIVDQGSAKRETSSFVKDTEIHGRKEEKEKLIKLLISSDANQVEGGYAACIPIIGHGGIGKTTLAQLAYNDKRVIRHFDVRMWIFVSNDFNITKIMKGIIESVTKSKCEITGIDELQTRVWYLLHNKRFLLVLDDVWTEDLDDWEKLTPLFREGVDGCKIVVTTRSRKIPLMMDSSIPYQLDGLTFDDCLSLFNQRAFGRGGEEKYPHLVLIGKQIVKKCGGFPLAVKSLGSVMRFKREEGHWLFMQNSELWQLDVCQQKVLPALMLSYLHLPSHLRQCFAFCSLFPKNYEFKKQKLIHQWMAEGFVLRQGSKRLEDIGDEYFSDLLWMSFFQEVEVSENEDVVGYRMNNVIHDLARYVAGEESVILEAGLPPYINPSQIRHSSIVYTNRDGEITIPLEALYAAEHSRTLLFLGDSGLLSNMGRMFSSFVYLRLLDLSGCDVSSFPDALGGLICLRYLDLSYTPIENLPLRVCALVSLQTLNLIGCYNLRSLPSLERMTCLRHLNLTGCEQLIQMPAGIESLHQLQTLPLYVAGRGCRLSELKQLNLYDKLNLTHLEEVRHAAEAKTAGLMTKKNLDSLGLYWGLYQPRSEDVDISLGIVPKRREDSRVGFRTSMVAQQEKHAEEILDSLQPPKNMKKLFINGYPGFRFAAWVLPEYVIAVEIANCQNCGHLPALGNLLLLKTLSLHGMHGVRRIGTEFYGDGADIRFPSLEKLSLSDFPNLEEWTSANSENSFPSLKKLTVKRCPKLAHIPSPQSLQHLELQDCNLMLTPVANLGLLSVLVLENIPGLLTLPEGLTASACLSSLKILSCPKLRSLPLQIRNLTALKSLTIRCCEELSSLPQTSQNLKALESLEISNCHSIISMPDGWIGGLCSLRTLSIENCSNLTSLSSSLERLTLLEHLTIMFCPNLGPFPEGVQHLSSLRSLILLSCPWFDSLPEGLQNVRTLHCLKIGSCPNLTALPEWFAGLDSLRSLTIFDCPGLQLLPPGFKILTKLQHLSIQECPELEERCRQGSGEDWLKIAHVPHKYIGPPQARQSGEASTSGS